jgi:hypothetical protein
MVGLLRPTTSNATETPVSDVPICMVLVHVSPFRDLPNVLETRKGGTGNPDSSFPGANSPPGAYSERQWDSGAVTDLR